MCHPTVSLSQMKMSKEDMAQVTGLHQRNGVYQLRVMVPKDLRDHYGKSSVRTSLGTSSRTEATYKATLARADWLAQFEQKRRELHPQVLDKVTHELAMQLAERIRASVLGMDDTLRDQPAVLEAILDVGHTIRASALNGLVIGEAPPPAREPDPPGSSLDGLSERQASELAQMNREVSDHSAQLMARRQLYAILPLAQAQARKLGLSFNENTPGAREALKVCLSAYREALLDTTRRDAGHYIEAPRFSAQDTKVTTLQSNSSRTLRDVFERWKASGESPRKKDSIQAMDRALRQFESQYPGLLLEDITREMGDKYRTWLRENSGTPKTARDRLTAIKTLLRYAHRVLEWTQRHTWEGLDIKAKTTNKRRAITAQEMSLLFSTPLHTQYALPARKQGGRDAAYWIPLIGAFTGARLGEVCQLRTADVTEVDNIPALILTDDQEDQSIKSEAGHRIIPIHSELVRLGFLGYAEAMKKAKHASLWPSLPLRSDKLSDKFGRWFHDFREELGLTGKGKPTFHYFRHTVRPLMRRAGFSSKIQDLITGHEIKGSVGDVVYDGVLLEELIPAIESIRYPYLSLPVVSPHAKLST